MVPRCGFENQENSLIDFGWCNTSYMFVQSIHVGSGVNLFLY